MAFSLPSIARPLPKALSRQKRPHAGRGYLLWMTMLPATQNGRWIVAIWSAQHIVVNDSVSVILVPDLHAELVRASTAIIVHRSLSA